MPREHGRDVEACGVQARGDPGALGGVVGDEDGFEEDLVRGEGGERGGLEGEGWGGVGEDGEVGWGVGEDEAVGVGGEGHGGRAAGTGGGRSWVEVFSQVDGAPDLRGGGAEV